MEFRYNYYSKEINVLKKLVSPYVYANNRYFLYFAAWIVTELFDKIYGVQCSTYQGMYEFVRSAVPCSSEEHEQFIDGTGADSFFIRLGLSDYYLPGTNPVAVEVGREVRFDDNFEPYGLVINGMKKKDITALIEKEYTAKKNAMLAGWCSSVMENIDDIVGGSLMHVIRWGEDAEIVPDDLSVQDSIYTFRYDLRKREIYLSDDVEMAA